MTKSAENIEKIEAQLEEAETVKSTETSYRSKRTYQAKGTATKR